MEVRKLSSSVSMMILVLCTCIIASGAVEPQKRRVEEIDDTLAQSCKHVLPHSDGGNSDDHEMSSNLDLEQVDILRRLQINGGDYSVEDGAFRLNATGSPESRLRLRVVSASRTAYKDVYLVRVSIYLQSAVEVINLDHFAMNGNENFPGELNSDFHGVFSNQTGLFCATLCAGRPPHRERSRGDAYRLQTRDQHSTTPAEFVFLSAGRYNFENVTRQAFVEWDCDVHIELQYPRSRTIATSIVHGVMTSLRAPSDSSFFHPIHIYGMSGAEYEYNTSLFHQVASWGNTAKEDIAPENKLEVWYLYPPFCPPSELLSEFSTIWIQRISAVFNATCEPTEDKHCSPFRNYHRRMGQGKSAVSVMRIENVDCTRGPNWRVSAQFIFREYWFVQDSDFSHLNRPLTEFLLVAEGHWNIYKPGQLVMVAYYLASDGTLVDSKIQITLQVPTIRTLLYRYGIVGHIRSMREASDALYFKTFSFLGEIQTATDGFREKQKSMFQLKYRYDSGVNGRIQPICKVYSNREVLKHTRFPDGSRFSDFLMSCAVQGWGLSSPQNPGNSSVDSASPYWTPYESLSLLPFSILDRIQPDSWSSDELEAGLLDVRGSFSTDIIPMSFKGYLSLQTGPFEIAAEGWYNSETGHLCMLGCRHSADSVAISHYENGDVGERNSAANDDSCDVVFSIQYPPTNPRVWAKRPFVTGNVTSLLDASHPLYFQPLVLNSTKTSVMYREQLAWSVLRRNLETILCLVSLSLTTLFVTIQVGYSGKETRFKNLRYVSLVMLIILTSGHLIPLLLSVKAIWIRRRSMLTYQWEAFYVDKWEEAYEVITRGTSMVALIFELRFLQLVLKSRSRAGTAPSNSVRGNGVVPPKISDTVVLQACLPLYATVMTVVAIVHWHVSPGGEQVHYGNQYTPWEMIWADIVAFSGVVLDLFLVPQVIANAVWDIPRKVAPLYPVFYIGMTLVRSAAHLFDAGRAMNFITEDSSHYFYANPNWDLYSTTWDILIPCLSILLATLLFFQQKYGGRCFIPFKRSQSKTNYEQVPSLQL